MAIGETLAVLMLTEEYLEFTDRIEFGAVGFET